MPEPNEVSVYTFGHSTRDIDDFISILKEHKISILVDLRTIPKSRFNPQFGKEALEKSLEREKIKYLHFKGLGGLRKPKKDSINTGWRNESFRGYADYMQTEEFEKNLSSLIELINQANKKKGNVALMCAEAVPWRCHRSLVSDALTIRGFSVKHILNAKSARPHKITSFAKVMGTKITYES
ncbi:MAG: DUF488 domain-containing protein [Nitrososphaerales archaeon]